MFDFRDDLQAWCETHGWILNLTHLYFFRQRFWLTTLRTILKPNLVSLYKRGPLSDYFTKIGLQPDHFKDLDMKRAASGAILGMSSPTSFEEI